jgi:hypothetical protein
MEDDIVVEIEGEEPDIAVEIELIEPSFSDNLLPLLDENFATEIGLARLETYNTYKNARANWETEIKQGIKWLGIQNEDAPDWMPEGSCSAVHPLLMENVVKFQAKAIQELWPAKGPVRTKAKLGTPPPTMAVAERVRAFLNYQLTELVPGFYADVEQNLFRVGFLGTGIRKMGWNAVEGMPDPVVVAIENFLVDPTIMHLRHQDEYIERQDMSTRIFERHVAEGRFAGCDADLEEQLELDEITMALAEAQGFDVQLERRGFPIAESHCYLDLQGADPETTGTAPYVVHFNYKSGQIYAIRRNWDEGDATQQKIIWYTVDRFIPGMTGFHGYGYLHLIGSLSAANTAILRALVDAGIYANFQGGYKSKDLKIRDEDTPLSFGEFRDVDGSIEDLSKGFFPLPTKEPSQTLFQMLQFLVQTGQKFADTTDQVVQDSSNYGPVQTTLALLEAAQGFYNSIHKRLHQSQHDYFRLLGKVNRDNLPAATQFSSSSANGVVYATDFDPKLVDILPASDPNAMTESQRIAKAQIELETAMRLPQIHDQREAVRRFYVAIGAENIDALLPNPDEGLSADPLSEIQAAIKGKPIKAQMGQNHQAHIAVKELFLQQPQMQGSNDPTVAIGKQLILSNVGEHKMLMFVSQIAQVAMMQGLPLNDERVQMVIAQQMLAQNQPTGGQPSVEQQMLANEKRQLDQTDARQELQAVTAAAKIEKDRDELALKTVRTLAELKQKEDAQLMKIAENLLDYASKKSQSGEDRLEQLANDRFGTRS